MKDTKEKVFDTTIAPFERLVALMAVLRSPEGCAWDRKQTHKSLLPYLIEETYEVAETIENEDYQQLKEELGDLVCQAVFHAQLASERNEFDINDSLKEIVDKLIRRHPHVFEEQKALDPGEVRDQWERIKVDSGEKKSVLGGIPASMPALVMAFRIGEKAGGVGFDWKNPQDVVAKIEEELKELREALQTKNQDAIEDEIGDLLFAIASLSRKKDIDPERALKRALQKFTVRFEKLEHSVKKSGKRFNDFSLDELEKIWQENK